MAEQMPGRATALRDVPWIVAAGLPLATCLVLLVVPLFGYEAWSRILLNSPATHAKWEAKELGAIERGTVVLLIPTIVLSFLVFLRRKRLPRHVGIAALIFCLAAVYFAGEEASWGQHIFGFETPEAMQPFNRQEEFNLHNTKGSLGVLLDEAPRMAATLAMIAGATVPFFLRRRNRDPNWRRTFWYWIVPTDRLVAASALAAGSTLPEKIMRAAHAVPAEGSYLYMALYKPGGEFKEYAIALAMFLYALSIYLRSRSGAALGVPATRQPSSCEADSQGI